MLLTAVACSDFLEKDISSKKVKLLAPVDNFKTSVSSITFWWEALEGSTKYQIQVVSPSFDSVQFLVLDSMTANITYSYTFVPGKYQWGVIAINNSSLTARYVRSFSIDTSNFLTGDNVILISPKADIYTSDSLILFKWGKIPAATQYQFGIRLNSATGDYYMPPIITTSDTSTQSLPDGTYYWSVQAQNNTSASITTSRRLYVDRTPPSTPILLLPNDNDTLKISDNKIFTWEHPGTSLAHISDSILIGDTLFNHIFEQAFRDTTYYQATSINKKGKYFWKVKSIDLAGNKSEFSVSRRLIVN